MDEQQQDVKVKKWKKSLCLVPACCNFPRDEEERLYRDYTKRQRQRAVPRLLIAGLLLQGFAALVPGEADLEFAYTLASVGFVINILLLAVYLAIQRFRPALLHITWVALWVQLLISVSRRRERSFNELLGWAALFQYLTLAALPFHKLQLTICSFLSLASYLAMQYFNAAVSDSRLPQDFFWQEMANMTLLVATTFFGMVAYGVTEGEQRAAFRKTKNSLRDKLTIEQQSKEQERLLLSVLPEHVAVQMRKELGLIDTQFKKIYMSRHENVSILYADIVGFTAISSTYSAQDLVAILNELFARFDRLAEKYHQLRIKILGDCYYCISGAPVERPDHAVLCVHMGLSMVKAIKYVQQTTNSPVDMRVGIHTGAVLAGVLGQRQWQFDVYSRDVELANKMESSGKAGRVHVSEVTLSYLNDEFEVEPAYGEKREEILRQASIKTYFISRVLKPFQGGEEKHIEGEGEGEETDTMSDLRDDDEDSVLSPQDGNSNNDEAKILSMLEEELVNRDDDRVEPSGEPSCVSGQLEPRGPLIFQRFNLAILALVAASALYPDRLGVDIDFIYLVPFAETAIIDLVTYAVYKYRQKSSLLWNVSLGIFNILMIVATNSVFLYICASFEEMGKDDLLPNAPSHGNIRRCDHPSYFYQAVSGMLVGILGAGGGWKVRGGLMLVTILAHTSPLLVSPHPFTYVNHYHNVTDTQVQNFLITFHENRHMLMLMFIFLAVLVFDKYCEDVEVARAWRGRRMREQAEQAAELRRRNQALIHNVLPPHVAQHFMGARRSHRDLYSQSYAEVGVLFASMPNFSEFYSEESVNNQGLECLRFLNEVISDFDMLLEDPKYHDDITKIKTISSTYMAASGLSPTRQMQESDGVTVRWAHLAILVQFALELQRVLAAINEQSFNHFVLRLGVNHGPITAGVIGARKPHYDIWGNTVNVASRMESTGKAGCIQVTEETCHILEQFGYYFEQRGLVAVKGKGQLMTYYLMGCNKDKDNDAQCSLDDLLGEDGADKALLSNGASATAESKV